MKSLFFPPRRATESTRATESLADQVIATGAVGGYMIDPIDGDVGFTRAGTSGRAMPSWTLEKSRAYSVVAYRANPMARAIIDTYVSFCVGDSGVTVQCSNPAVKQVALDFWNDPKVKLGPLQPDMCRDHLLMGESVYELMTGPVTGVTRWSPIDPIRVEDVILDRGNALWPAALVLRNPNGDPEHLTISNIDDITGLRTGQCAFFTSFKALLTDRRGVPFLAPILDDLDDYDSVLSNLIDRTSIMRYIGMDVTLHGDVGQKEIDDYIRERGGNHIPHSGTMEIHNDAVTIAPFNAQTGAMEDTETAKAVLTNIAGGAGLAKTWLADPQDSNRATSLTMAEPVRRRVGGVQNIWIAYMTEMVRHSVDQKVAVGMLDRFVPVTGSGGITNMTAASQTVSVQGPEIAAQNAEVNATVLMNLAQALDSMVAAKVMTLEAAQLAAKKGWESFVGVPYMPELDKADGSALDDTAELIESTPGAGLRLA